MLRSCSYITQIVLLDSGRASLSWDLVYGDLDLHDIEVEPCGDSYCQVCHTYYARRSCPNSFLDFDRIWPVSSFTSTIKLFAILIFFQTYRPEVMTMDTYEGLHLLYAFDYSRADKLFTTNPGVTLTLDGRAAGHFNPPSKPGPG